MKEADAEWNAYSVFLNRMFIRNNSLKASLIMGVVMAWFMYGVMAIFFLKLDSDEDNIRFHFTTLQLIFGGVSNLFSNFFAYLSSFHADLDIKKIDLRRLLASTYQKSLWFSLVVYLLPIPVFYEKSKLAFMMLESALFYMGMGVFLNLCISAFTSQYLTIHAKKVDEVKSKNVINAYFLIPWLALGVILVLDWLLGKVTSSMVGHSVVITIELTFIFTFRLWINVVLKIFRKNRYKKMELYLSM